MKGHNTGFLSELISFASTGFNALDEQSRSETKEFIISQQNRSGGFNDRGGVPDAYYSLFGFFLSRAVSINESEVRLKTFIKEEKGFKKNLINRCCIAIIENETGSGLLKKISGLTGILFTFLSGSGGLSSSYQYFIVLLALDSYRLNNSLTRLIVRTFLRKNEIRDSMPCPVQAAHLVLKLKVGLDTGNEQHRISGFFDEGKGFKAFYDSENADLLSTAVALFALRMGKYDLIRVRHTCLLLLQDSYHSGAFVAGNGDEERDTEYTFYGLLALGLLTR